MFFLLVSGLQIFNAYPRLHWGARGASSDAAWVQIGAVNTPQGLRGVTRIGSLSFDTTGVLGVSAHAGRTEVRAFPAWTTLPASRNLALGRRWHFFFAWVLALNGLAYLGWSLLSRHLGRDLWPTRADLKGTWRSVVDHVRLRHPKGEAAKRYNVLQKFAYLAVILVLGPGMVLTGLSMSPGFNTAAPWLVDLFGGRPSARTLHFLLAGGLVVFVVVHVVEVFLAGFWNEMRSMITGRYVVPPETHATPEAKP